MIQRCAQQGLSLNLLVFKLFSVDALSAATSASGVSALNHEAGDDAVENDVVVLAGCGECCKILACLAQQLGSYRCRDSVQAMRLLFTLGVLSLNSWIVISPRVVCMVTPSALSPLPVDLPVGSPGLLVEDEPPPEDGGWSDDFPPNIFFNLSMSDIDSSID